MDVIRSCYVTKMRLHADDPGKTTDVVWYRSEPGARAFPGQHRFGSLDWDGRYREGPLGEAGPRGAYYVGWNWLGKTGQSFCGERVRYVEGVSTDTPTCAPDDCGALLPRLPVVAVNRPGLAPPLCAPLVGSGFFANITNCPCIEFEGIPETDSVTWDAGNQWYEWNNLFLCGEGPHLFRFIPTSTDGSTWDCYWEFGGESFTKNMDTVFWPFPFIWALGVRWSEGEGFTDRYCGAGSFFDLNFSAPRVF